LRDIQYHPPITSNGEQVLDVRAVVIVMLVFSTSAVAATAPEGGTHGPDGFGNIPYGSSSADALGLNHGNGEVAHNTGPPVLTYSTSVQGLIFDVTQNYDKSSKAIDAIAVSTSMESPSACIARFNYALGLLQTTYHQSGTSPLRSHTTGAEVTYTVLFRFDRSDGIEAQLVAPDPGGLATGSASTGNGGGVAAGPCTIRLHYLPPGWIGHF
jgi:hypothetical protein